MADRAVFLCVARKEEGKEERETQWSVRVGENCWTYLDVVQPGLRSSINGGLAGGWFGWGARQDGPLLQTSPFSQPQTSCLLATSSMTDSEIENFNKEYIAQQPVYRWGEGRGGG